MPGFVKVVEGGSCLREGLWGKRCRRGRPRGEDAGSKGTSCVQAAPGLIPESKTKGLAEASQRTGTVGCPLDAGCAAVGNVGPAACRLGRHRGRRVAVARGWVHVCPCVCF